LRSSVSCQSTFDKITISIGDENGSFSYTVDTSILLNTVQGLTLVMCEECSYMIGEYGMNVGVNGWQDLRIFGAVARWDESLGAI